MGDVEIAVGELRDLSTRLTGLSEDLMGVDAGAEYTTSELAHRSVIEAMDEFHSNWDDNREYVCGKLDDLAELATRTADGFTDADAELAAKINETMEKQ